MKKNNWILGITFLSVFILSCYTPKLKEEESTVLEQEIIEEANLEEYLILGDSITNHAQKILLANVSTAMKEGGPEHAIDFCNIAAMPLTDSISAYHSVYIQRITDKNRNPENILSTPMDSAVWNRIQAILSNENETPLHYVEQNEEGLYYYKAIRIGMPTCLACHGGKEDVSVTAMNLLAERYPDDKAKGYEMGDLRGLWKVKLK